MATVATDDPQHDDDSQPQESSSARKSFLSSKKIKILALLVLVMGVEAALFLMLVPQHSGGSGSGAGGGSGLDEIETVEVSLGKIDISNNKATVGVTISVQFNLLVEISKDQATAFDLLANRQRKGLVKSVVDTVVGSAHLEALYDPAHRLIARSIKEEINKALKKSYVIRVHITGWRNMPL
ncbi:MAG: hypothetical protein IID45_07175 [Planctomycetes bacterium]|nr:hypothetical protein [Planctomycetota bacterium]